jgi:hypothetical protein
MMYEDHFKTNNNNIYNVLMDNDDDDEDEEYTLSPSRKINEQQTTSENEFIIDDDEKDQEEEESVIVNEDSEEESIEIEFQHEEINEPLFPEEESDELHHNTKSASQRSDNTHNDIKNPKLSREMKRLDAFFNPQATRMHEELTKPQEDSSPATTIAEEPNNLITLTPPNEQLDRALTMISLQPLAIDEIQMVDKNPISYMYNVSTINDTKPFQVPDHQLKDILNTPST